MTRARPRSGPRTLTAVASYSAPHTLSAVVSGVGGMIAAVALQAGLWVRAVGRKLGML